MIRYVAIAAAACLLAVTARGQAPGEPGGDFADAPEKPLVTATCTACHVAAQVTGQRRSKAEWTEIVDKMIGFGARVPDDKYETIVGYLARFYGDGAQPPAKPAA